MLDFLHKNDTKEEENRVEHVRYTAELSTFTKDTESASENEVIVRRSLTVSTTVN